MDVFCWYGRDTFVMACANGGFEPGHWAADQRRLRPTPLRLTGWLADWIDGWLADWLAGEMPCWLGAGTECSCFRLRLTPPAQCDDQPVVKSSLLNSTLSSSDTVVYVCVCLCLLILRPSILQVAARHSRHAPQSYYATRISSLTALYGRKKGIATRLFLTDARRAVESGCHTYVIRVGGRVRLRHGGWMYNSTQLSGGFLDPMKWRVRGIAEIRGICARLWRLAGGDDIMGTALTSHH